MECFQTALEIAAAVLTPLLAVTVIWTSIRQYRLSKQGLTLSSQGLSLNRERLKFDERLTLFDKRLDVFRGMQRFLLDVCQHPRHISEQHVYDYVRETALREFLLDDRRKGIMEDVYSKGNDFVLHNSQRENRRDELGRKKYIEEERKLFGWFKEQLMKNNDEFRDYFEFN